MRRYLFRFWFECLFYLCHMTTKYGKMSSIYQHGWQTKTKFYNLWCFYRGVILNQTNERVTEWAREEENVRFGIIPNRKCVSLVACRTQTQRDACIPQFLPFLSESFKHNVSNRFSTCVRLMINIIVICKIIIASLRPNFSACSQFLSVLLIHCSIAAILEFKWTLHKLTIYANV